MIKKRLKFTGCEISSESGYYRNMFVKYILKIFLLSFHEFISSWSEKIATFRLEYEDDHEYEFSVLSTRFRFGGRIFEVRVLRT